MTEPAERASCEEHPDAERAPCEKCGDFLCVDCLPLEAPARCRACRVRYGIEDVPWEASGGSLPRRAFRTVRAFVTRPTRTLERTRTQRPWAALRYLGLVSFVAVVGVGNVVLLRDLVRGSAGAVGRAGAVLVLLGAAILTSAALRFLVFHGVARLLGGSASWRTSLSSVGYLQSVLLLLVPLSVVTWVPGLAPLVFSLAALGLEAFLAVNLTTAARLYHGLPTGRAAVAAWAPFAMVLAAVVLGCGFLGAVIDAAGYTA